MRSRSFGKRIFDRPEKTFNNNFHKSIRGGQFSPIPKGLTDQMAAMKINKQGTKTHGSNSYSNNPRQPTTHVLNPYQISGQMGQKNSPRINASTEVYISDKATGSKIMKRKLGNAGILNAEVTASKDGMAGLEDKAGQQL